MKMFVTFSIKLYHVKARYTIYCNAELGTTLSKDMIRPFIPVLESPMLVDGICWLPRPGLKMRLCREAIRAGFDQYFGGEEGIIISLPHSCIDIYDLLRNEQLYTIVNSRILLTDDSGYAEVPTYHEIP
jgi:hypothetical protein